MTIPQLIQKQREEFHKLIDEDRKPLGYGWDMEMCEYDCKYRALELFDEWSVNSQSSLLTAIKEEVEKMKKEGKGLAEEQPVHFGHVMGYNEALDDIIKILTQLNEY